MPTVRTIGMLGLASAMGWACSRYDEGELFACQGPECPAPCEEGAVRCVGSHPASCQAGVWVEEFCAGDCVDGRCVVCREDERRCTHDGMLATCERGRFVTETCENGVCEDGACSCLIGVGRCDPTAGRQVCDESGQWRTDACADPEPECHDGRCVACVPSTSRCLDSATSWACTVTSEVELHPCDLGCDDATGACHVQCTPGDLRCAADGLHVQVCSADGGSWEAAGTCDAEAGDSCIGDGQCESSCALAEARLAPSGCRFFAPQVLGWSGNMASFHVGPLATFHLINPDPVLTARVIVWWDFTSQPMELLPGTTGEISVPGRVAWNGNSRHLHDGAVRIESNVPIFVVAHLEIEDDGKDTSGAEDAVSGDTAFLLPQHLLRSRYRVITQPNCENSLHPRSDGRGWRQPGGFSVVSASPESAQLQIEFTSDTAAGPGSDPPAFTTGDRPTVTLPMDDVIHFLGDTLGLACTPASGSEVVRDADLTSTLIESDRPVSVFVGGISRVPWCAGCHVQTQLMEQLMPVEYWDKEHVLAARSIPRPDDSRFSEERWVILTDEGNNRLDFDPPLSNGTTSIMLDAPGEALVFNTVDDPFKGYRAFRLSSTAPVLIGRYLYAVGGEGGSTFTLERPRKFWRGNYLLQAVGAAQNRLLLIVPDGATVVVDGTAVARPYLPGPPGHGLVEQEVLPGLHRIAADAEFGLLLYGYSLSETRVAAFKSYSYSGPVGFGDHR